jgi:hypothetical protein
MLDQWDDNLSPTLPWYRRFDVRWGLCTSLMLVVGFFLGWSTSWLRSSELAPSPAASVLPSLDPFCEPQTVTMKLPEQEAIPESNSPTSIPTAVTKSQPRVSDQGS